MRGCVSAGESCSKVQTLLPVPLCRWSQAKLCTESVSEGVRRSATTTYHSSKSMAMICLGEMDGTRESKTENRALTVVNLCGSQRHLFCVDGWELWLHSLKLGVFSIYQPFQKLPSPLDHLSLHSRFFVFANSWSCTSSNHVSRVKGRQTHGTAGGMTCRIHS
jgi:hypothetical protein